MRAATAPVIFACVEGVINACSGLLVPWGKTRIETFTNGFTGQSPAPTAETCSLPLAGLWQGHPTSTHFFGRLLVTQATAHKDFGFNSFGPSFAPALRHNISHKALSRGRGTSPSANCNFLDIREAPGINGFNFPQISRYSSTLTR